MRSIIVFAVGFVAAISGFQIAGAVAPADFGLHEGDMVSSVQSDGNPDIFIINQFGFKRLFLNEVIFRFYGHLRYENVRQVSAATRDAFRTSLLFRNCEASDARLFVLEETGPDTGTLHPLAMSEQQAQAEDPNYSQKVFCINNAEFDWYTNGGRSLGSYYTSFSQVPGFGPIAAPPPSGMTPAPIPSQVPVPTTRDIFSRWAPSVAQLLCSNATERWSGSGTFLRMKNGDHVLLTNLHVYATADSCIAVFREDVTGGSTYASTIRVYNTVFGGFLSPKTSEDEVYLEVVPFTSAQRESALETLEWASRANFPSGTSELQNIARKELCSSSDAAIGDRVAVIGYPGSGAVTTPTLSEGIISGRDDIFYVTSAKIDAGVSGGAAVLVDHDCYLGIPTGTMVGPYESFGRILDITRYDVFGRSIPGLKSANILDLFKDWFR